MQYSFDVECRRCSRLAEHLEAIRHSYPDYHARPVDSFGEPSPRLLVVGLAPGMHGANATGRPFTGDYAGIILYRCLYKAGFCDREEAVHAQDGLTLIDCRITNAVRCLPPGNKPTGAEVRECNTYLREELAALESGTVILAVGGTAHRAILRALGLRQRDYPFAHGQRFDLGDQRWLLDSYHCSRYNINTRRLTEQMFMKVVRDARRLIEKYRAAR